MHYLQITIICFVALQHFLFMILEMFYWDKPLGLKTFRLKLEDAKKSKILAKNQGLYNGFLAIGLCWSLIELKNTSHIALFFLICISVAGIYGAVTTKNIKLFYVQSIPAIIGIIITLLNK